jgi:hypothetical protein
MVESVKITKDGEFFTNQGKKERLGVPMVKSEQWTV